MIETSPRPLTEAERRGLTALLVTRGSLPDVALAGLFTFMLVTGGLLLVAPPSWMTGPRSLIPPGVALVAAALVAVRVRRGRRVNAWREALEGDLDQGQVTTTTYHVRDAIAVEEYEDEGSQYFLALGDGRVVFLVGQYLYEVEDEGGFPNTIVVIDRLPTSELVLDLRCIGEPFEASSRRPPFRAADFDEGRVPQDGALVDVAFDGLRS